MAAASQDVGDLVLALGVASKVLQRDEVRQVDRLCEAAKAFLDGRMRGLIMRAGNRALLLSYCADGTPLKTKERTVTTLLGKRVVRVGGSLEEFYLEKVFAAYQDIDGIEQIAALFRDPLPLTSKLAWYLFACGKAFIPLARGLGHRGILVHHYAFDRAVYSALVMRFGAWHDLRHTQRPDNGNACIQSELLWLTEWIVATGCCCHDVHNSLKWSVHALFQNESMIKDLFVVVESLRNSYSLLVAHLPKWLRRSVRFVAPQANTTFLHTLWTSLQIDSEVVDVLVSLELRWSGDRLEVCNRFEDDPHLMHMLSGALLHLWRFRKFCDSRWITVGVTCRTLVIGLLTGLHDTVRYIREETTASDYYIHGFARLIESLREFISIVAFGSVVSDALLCCLLEDDRVAGRVDELEAALTEEVQWLLSLPGHVWGRVACVISDSYSGHTLRSLVLLAAFRSLAFADKRILREAKSFPWSPARGNVDENLRRLGAMPDQTESTTKKIQTLVRFGFNMQQLVDGVGRLRQVSWSTTTVEQCHGSASTLMKAHGDYGKKTLMARAMVHMMRPLFQQPQELKQADSLDARVGRWSRKRPDVSGGRQQYFKECMGVAKTLLAPGAKMSKYARQAIMSWHGAEYKKMSEEQHRGYEFRADMEQSMRALALQDDIEQLRAVSRSKRQRVANVSDAPFRMSNCRLNREDRDAFSLLYHSSDFAESRVQSLREAALRPHDLPTVAEQTAIINLANKMPEVAVDRRAWVADVCRCRDAFADSIFAFRTADRQGHFYLFLFAVQSPFELVFLPLHREERLIRIAQPEGFNCLDQLTSHYDHHFFFDSFRTVLDSDIYHGDDMELFVLPQVSFFEGQLLCSHSSFVPFADFLIVKEQSRQQRGPRGGKGTVLPDCALEVAGEEQAPWLEQFRSSLLPKGRLAVTHWPSLAPVVAGVRGDVGVPPSSGSDESEEDPMPEGEGSSKRDRRAARLDDDGFVDDVFKALEKRREEWAEEEDLCLASEFFKVSVMGGPWTKAHLGVDFDSFRGHFVGNEVARWCGLYSLCKSASFSLSKYGDAHASIMAQSWCHRMSYFYRLWRASKDPAFQYTEGEASLYKEPDEFTALFADGVPGHVVARTKTIRAISPRMPRCP